MVERRKTVLVIDDSPEYTAMLEQVLQPHVTVVTARDGLEGYHFACAQRIDAVVLDILMPIVDGWTVCRKLRANPATARVPIVIVTSLDAAAVGTDVAGLRIAKVVYRPCTPEKIWEAVSAALECDGRHGV